MTVTVALAGTYDGAPFSGTYTYTRVWAKDGRGWRVQAAHCSGAAD